MLQVCFHSYKYYFRSSFCYHSCRTWNYDRYWTRNLIHNHHCYWNSIYKRILQ